jgi:hypothetical protein
MTLSTLIRKRDTVRVATAIPAIFATQPKGEAATVARIATVAVANPKEERTASPEKVGAGDTAITSRWWFIHYHDRDPVEMTCCPEATHAEILERHPDAVAAEPFTPTIRQASAPLTAKEETAIRTWLALIEEPDPPTVEDVLMLCRRNADARDYFSGQAAAELPKPDPFSDDRVTCNQCANLIARRCQAAKHGEIVASRNYEPIRDLPRRCEGYATGVTDTDRRPGRERWPGLTDTKGTE